ncbi:MAG: prolipoprotein diacylglyceryl transferase [Tepidisphaeraceae bacterium]|jgi:phosphatidylglycerol:prolipoprotein diacylglycerol transferase
MLQEIFRFSLLGHEIPVYGYGLMLVVAFLACVKTGQWLGKGRGIHPDVIVNAAIIALVSGVIGARLCHVLENFHEYTRHELSFWRNLGNAADMRAGGLTFYGGFLLATPCCIFYAWKKKVPILTGMDVVAPVLMVGLAVGRIGCFLNGCCYGERCDLPWAVRFPYDSEAYVDQFAKGQITVPPELLRVAGDGSYRLISPHSPEMQNNSRLQRLAAASRALGVHPAELYSSFTAFLLAALLIAYFALPHADGRVFALMMILEGIARFVLELLRVEPAVWHVRLGGQTYGWSISMILGLLIAVAGVVMWNLLPPLRRSRTACAGTP